MKSNSSMAILEGLIEDIKTDTIDDSYEMLSPRQVAKELNLHINTVYRIISTGQLRVYNLSVGRDKTYYRISREDLEDYLHERYCVK